MRVKCECKWLDLKTGLPTPDENDAIALAVCYDPVSFGETGSKPFPVCEEHAKMRATWERGREHWKFLPLPGYTVEESHAIVREDAMFFRITPQVVIDSIKNAFPKEATEILKSLRWSGDHYSFNRWGMYVGVELSGEIHT